MSTEERSGERQSNEGTKDRKQAQTALEEQVGDTPNTTLQNTHEQEGERSQRATIQSSQIQAQSAQESAPTSQSNATGIPAAETEEVPRQVIAVSASKGPAAFFNLARKFLATDEMCDLSALEGAIVSAVDAAHLLERSQLATIIRVNTSYVTVEPKRRKQSSQSSETEEGSNSQASNATAKPAATVTSTSAASSIATSPATVTPPGPGSVPPLKSPPEAIQSKETTSTQQQGNQVSGRHASSRSSGRELRRARIVITVRRTQSYKRWLEENPLQAIIAGEGEASEADAVLAQAPGGTEKGSI